MEKDLMHELLKSLLSDIGKKIKEDDDAPKQLKATTILTLDLSDSTHKLLEFIKDSNFSSEYDEQYDGIIYHANCLIDLIEEIVNSSEDKTTVLKFEPDNPF